MAGPDVSADVLIVGAGPTGLVLALWLVRGGVGVRIIDKAPEPGTTSRALAIQARTLEFYAQLGIANEVVRRGRLAAGVNLWVRGHRVAHAPFGELGQGLSPYPYVLIFPQDEHERLLIDELASLGVFVERRTELVGVDEVADGVRARLRRANGVEETFDTQYLAGCDGAHSMARQATGVGFPGGTYEHLFYVADIEGRGNVLNGEVHVGLDRADFLAAFPLTDLNRARLVGTIRTDDGRPDSAVSWNDVGRRVIEWMRLDVGKVHWFSTYRVHHRVASHFRAGRIFLLGDAAHIHSPVGGQGMNTGIGDAVNLAWKLVDVLRGGASVALLESYEPERIALARRLVATTDRGFTAVTSSDALARAARLYALPLIVPAAFAIPAVRRFLFRTVSQTMITYRGGPISDGHVGSVHGGDRLPWVPVAEAASHDNFTPLASLDWQVHVYGRPSDALRELCQARQITLHMFFWHPRMSQQGLAEDTICLVRPDGHVAAIARGSETTAIREFLDRPIVARSPRVASSGPLPR